MDNESFTDLAMRVISREATDDERRALEAEFVSAPARREEFERLKLTHDVLRATAPMAQAARAITPGLPAYRVNELRTAVRQHFGPAANRPKSRATSGGLISVLRWIFAGGGLAMLGCAVVLLCFENRSIEIGLYQTDLMRNGDKGLSAADVPSARLVAFDQDGAFDQWQNRPLAWNERAKIWVDNEHDLLHIVRRVQIGQVLTDTRPLAPTNEGQREQIKRVVEELKNQSL
ncbi:MAG TPA: hypothetical protein VGZ93_11200 [Candidatus Methylacidiphilales bacterium]|jgi:hypothetical protein|nr:hypothetical protein [Candidatus Methylacidiphilales bacterium]